MISARKLLGTLLLAATAYASGAPTDFTGKWSFDPTQSKNVGMMAQGKITTVIAQTKVGVIVDDTSVFVGPPATQHTVYDLTGKATPNESMMAGKATTHSHWDGMRLVTKWESAGAIAGTVVERTETRYLSADRKVMYVESVRAGKEPIVMVFVRSK
ncbi:MAG: hypothetical protein ABI147_03085 [Acidobacteriaceae bacterium]